MDIAQLSSAISLQNTSAAVSTAVLSMSLDTVEKAGDGIVKMMELSVNPNVGNNLDIKI